MVSVPGVCRGQCDMQSISPWGDEASAGWGACEWGSGRAHTFTALLGDFPGVLAFLAEPRFSWDTNLQPLLSEFSLCPWGWGGIYWHGPESHAA